MPLDHSWHHEPQLASRDTPTGGEPVDQRDVRGSTGETGGSFGVVLLVFAFGLPGGWPCSNPKIHHAMWTPGIEKTPLYICGPLWKKDMSDLMEVFQNAFNKSFGMNDFMASCDGFTQKVNIVQFGTGILHLFFERPCVRQIQVKYFFEIHPGTADVPCCSCQKNQGPVGIPHRRHTLLKINMEHNHGGLEDHFPFPELMWFVGSSR